MALFQEGWTPIARSTTSPNIHLVLYLQIVHVIDKSDWYWYSWNVLCPLIHKWWPCRAFPNPSPIPIEREALERKEGNDPPPASVRKQEKNGLIDFPSAILVKEENKWHIEAVRWGKIELRIFDISQAPIFLWGINKRNCLKHMETLLNNSQAGQAEE